ncbi:MAG TPA: hypothetical protein VMR50_19565 [Myxococcota bacterium]|nr:hypothetical protein [Myxococcota bacterium]
MGVRSTQGLALCLALVLGCSRELTPPPAPETAGNAQTLAADLAQLRGANVLFVHDAIGTQVLEAVTRLDPGLALADVLGEADPNTAIDGFERAIAADGGPKDVALLELPFQGISGDTNGKALFTHYRRAIQRLRAAHPDVILVPVTVPLVARDEGLRGFLRTLIGAASARSRANTMRDDFNGRVREAFRGQPIFDLARVESLSGNPPTLSKDGRERAARALVAALANALRGRAPRPG